jgi:hypothetical protein
MKVCQGFIKPLKALLCQGLIKALKALRSPLRLYFKALRLYVPSILRLCQGLIKALKALRLCQGLIKAFKALLRLYIKALPRLD